LSADPPSNAIAAPQQSLRRARRQPAPPRTPLALSGSFGIEDGAFGDRKRDWTLGVSGEVAGFALGAGYVDTVRAGAGRLGRAGLVLSAGRSF
jgi:hypothetical protein